MPLIGFAAGGFVLTIAAQSYIWYTWTETAAVDGRRRKMLSSEGW
jgi:hypothetical protein